MPRVVAPAGTMLVQLTAEQLQEMIVEAVDRAVAENRDGQTPTPVLLDRRGIAAALGVSIGTVDTMVDAGMPFHRVAESKRFELAAVLEWTRARGRA